MAPDYHEIIKEPMDFATIRQKIDRDEYPDIASLKKDAELIVHNAMDYNSPGTIYHIAAQKMDLIVQFYFSEPYLRYLFHALPFSKVNFIIFRLFNYFEEIWKIKPDSICCDFFIQNLLYHHQ